MKRTMKELFFRIFEPEDEILEDLQFEERIFRYHSKLSWETVSEMVLEHYGLEVSKAAIYILVAIVPVTIDACFKLWVFRFFRTLSPSASATFREMQRH